MHPIPEPTRTLLLNSLFPETQRRGLAGRSFAALAALLGILSLGLSAFPATQAQAQALRPVPPLDELIASARATQELLDAYRDAVDAAHPVAAFQLGTAAVAAYELLRATRAQLADTGEVTHLDSALYPLEQALATWLGPQLFRGQTVMPGVHPVRLGAGPERAERLLDEVTQVGLLLKTSQEVEALLPGQALPECALLERKTQRNAVDLIDAWRGRPVNFAFLKEVLRSRGRWATIESAVGSRGKSLSDIDASVGRQALSTGPLHDVGDFDAERAETLLTPLSEADANSASDSHAQLDDQARAAANDVFAMIASAEPRARGGLIVQLASTGRLTAVMSEAVGRPWSEVELLHDSLPLDRSARTQAARRLLRPYFEGKGGILSVSRTLDEQISRRGDFATRWGLRALRFVYENGTFGFAREHDQAWDAMSSGYLTGAAYDRATLKAFGKASAIGIVSSVTGGAAGAAAGGYAGRLIGERAGALAEGMVGGMVSGFSGGASADTIDVLSGKRRWADVLVMDWFKAGGLGAGVGVGFSAAWMVGAEAARFLPPSLVTRGHRLLERYPQHSSLIHRLRAAGAAEGLAARTRILAKWSEVRRWIDDGILPPDSGLTLNPAGVLDGDAMLTLAIEPLQPINQAGDFAGPLLRISGVDGAGGKSVANGSSAGALTPRRFHGTKPKYHVNEAHVPGPKFNPKKTPLPPDAESVYLNAIPDDALNPSHWYGVNKKGQIYRFSDANNGTAHFSAIGEVGAGIQNMTAYAKARLKELQR
jgi:hypothetical protein